MSSYNPHQSISREPIHVRNSFESTYHRIEIPPKGSKAITLGDKMFARLVLRGKTVLEFIITTVRDLTELYSLLHSKCKGLRGLARLYLRNMSKGWSDVRPLMLYPEERVEGKKGVAAGKEYTKVMRAYKAQPATHVTFRDTTYGRYFSGEVRQLSFPWD